MINTKCPYGIIGCIKDKCGFFKGEENISLSDKLTFKVVLCEAMNLTPQEMIQKQLDKMAEKISERMLKEASRIMFFSLCP